MATGSKVSQRWDAHDVDFFKSLKMKKFTYWANKDGYHSEKIVEIDAADIVEADKTFLCITGEDPIKSKKAISVAITKIEKHEVV
jgi:hypothetical protein